MRESTVGGEVTFLRGRCVLVANIRPSDQIPLAADGQASRDSSRVVSQVTLRPMAER